MGPLTKGLSSREAVYTAHALEQEARYLTGRAHGGASVSGTGLKFVFPTLRRAVPQLLDGDLDLPRVRGVVEKSMETIYEAAVALTNGMDCELPSAAETEEAVTGIAGRVLSSIEGLRDVL